MSQFACFRFPSSVPWEWPWLFGEWLGFVDSKVHVYTCTCGASMNWRCCPSSSGWWSVSTTSMCWQNSGCSYTGSKYLQNQTFFFLILEAFFFLNPSAPKIFSLSYWHFLETHRFWNVHVFFFLCFFQIFFFLKQVNAHFFFSFGLGLFVCLFVYNFPRRKKLEMLFQRVEVSLLLPVLSCWPLIFFRHWIRGKSQG